MICTMCGKDKPEEDFWWRRRHLGERDPHCASCAATAAAKPNAASHRAYHKFTPAEDYIIEKLATKPSLAAALDNLYKRSPQRWHQVLVAAMLTRREQSK